jgi:hypothetical protein
MAALVSLGAINISKRVLLSHCRRLSGEYPMARKNGFANDVHGDKAKVRQKDRI